MPARGTPGLQSTGGQILIAPERQSHGRAGAPVRLVALLCLMTAIFVADTVTDIEIAVAVFYVAIVLIAAGFLETRGVIIVSAACVGLTVISFGLTPSGAYEAGLINCGLSLSAIGATTYLALKMASAILAENEARVQLARLARVNMLGELTSSIAHEVNQPLTAVVASGNACLRWLAVQPPNLPKAQQAVERIIKDANRASDVIARVRSLVKRGPPIKEWLNATNVVSEIIALTRSEMDSNHVVLRTQFASGLPPILADRVQIQQVLLNMILNAIEAMSTAAPEKRELQIRLEPKDERSAEFTVRDSGIGILSDKLEHLFDAFYTTKVDGMGIGLAISRSIVEAHGGRIWATANSGSGATFHFTLPTGGAEAP